MPARSGCRPDQPASDAAGVSSMSGTRDRTMGPSRELVPRAARFAVLIDNETIRLPRPLSPTVGQFAAAAVGRRIEVVTAGTSGRRGRGLCDADGRRADALVFRFRPVVRQRPGSTSPR